VAALAYRIDSSQTDLDTASAVTVDCPGCDPDSPTAVPRKQCPVCRGTGRSLVSLGAVVREIHQAMVEPSKQSTPGLDDDELTVGI